MAKLLEIKFHEMPRNKGNPNSVLANIPLFSRFYPIFTKRNLLNLGQVAANSAAAHHQNRVFV
jgi:hypothetical protein